MPKITLNPTFEAYRGKVGNIVYQEGREGTISRELVIPADPHTPAQTGARTAFGKSAAAYKNLTTQQVSKWMDYAEGITRRGRNGKNFHPTAIDIFISLSSKFLQINPTGTIPVAPPTSAFFGDVITLSATAGTSKITFAASGPNTTGVQTELLLVSLKSKNRVASESAYRTKAFFTYVTGTLSKDVTVTSGVYAPAYRFVNPATGQASSLTFLPNVTVL